jgi:aldehyde:ferredoxin oxidoreductase
VDIADQAAVLAAAKDLRARSFGPATAKYRELGTLANLLAFNAVSTLPTRNFTAATFEGAPRLAAEELHELRGVARNSCASCSIGCEHIYSRKGGGTQRMEYENVFALGPLCGVSDRTTCSPPAPAATSWGSTRSRRAARSPGRWSAPSAG